MTKRISNIFSVFEDPDEGFDPIHIICGTFVFYMLFILALKTPGDYEAHTRFAITLFDWNHITQSILNIPYPMWHISVNLLNRLLSISPVYAAALTSASFQTFEYCVIRKLLLSKCNFEIERFYIDLISCTFMFLQPIYIPFFNRQQMLGQGTPNCWHNPTIIVCYPFAIICIYLFSEIWKKQSEKRIVGGQELITFGIYLFLSVLAKPAFLQIFAPATAFLCIFEFIKTKGSNFIFVFKFVLSCIPAGLWCLLIFFLSFVNPETAKAGVGFGFLEVWKVYSPSVPISLLITMAFPLSYLIFNLLHKENKKKIMMTNSFFTIVITCLLCSILEYSILKENGPRMASGNFGWGYILGQTLLYLWVVIDFIPYLAENGKLKKQLSAPVVIYTLNLLCGALYYLRLFIQNIGL